MNRLGIFGIVTLGLWSSGCVVSQARYEEARSAIRVEQEAHRRTQARLTEVSRELDTSQQDLGARDQRIEALERDLSQAKLDTEVANSEKLYAVELVEQLREELGRTGDHLREFASEKGKLATALEAAQNRVKALGACEQEAADNAAVIRDLALLLHDSVATGDVELALVEGRAMLRVPSSELAGEAPGPVGQKLLAALGRIGVLHGEAKIRIGEVGAKAGDGEQAARLKHVADLFGAQGIRADRVELRPSGSSKPAPEPTLEISVFFEPPSGPSQDGTDKPPAS